MNDVILMIEFPKSTPINFYLIALGGVLNSTRFGDSHHSTYRETPYKIKNCLTYDVISNAYAIFMF